MSDTNNVALDTKVTPVNPTGRGGWVAVTVAILMTFEGLTNFHGGYSVGVHQSFDPKDINTICYGHIENVHIGDKMTKIQCARLLAKDLPRYEAMLERAIHVPMPGYRHAGILSFTYNVGGGALARSSVARYINAGEWAKGCDALLLYDKAAGRVLPGLVTRRKAERKLCYNTNEPPLPDEEVMKQPHQNVDQAQADREAAAIKLPPLPTPRPKVIVTEQPKVIVPAPVSAHWYSGIIHWIMEK